MKASKKGKHRKVRRPVLRAGATGLTAGAAAAAVLSTGGAASAFESPDLGIARVGQPDARAATPQGARGGDVEEAARAAQQSRSEREREATSTVRGQDVEQAAQAAHARSERSATVRPAAERESSPGSDVQEAAAASAKEQRGRAERAAAQPARGADVEKAAQSGNSAAPRPSERTDRPAPARATRPIQTGETKAVRPTRARPATPALAEARKVSSAPVVSDRPSALPRTGSADLGLLAVGGALVATGAGLVGSASSVSRLAGRRRGAHSR